MRRRRRSPAPASARGARDRSPRRRARRGRCAGPGAAGGSRPSCRRPRARAVLVPHQRAPLRGDAAGGDVVLRDLEALELVLRKVHAAEAPVLGHVAHDVDRLEREAHRLRARDGSSEVAGPVHGRAGEPDRAGDAATVLVQLLPRCVARPLDVHEPAGNEVEERALRDGIAAHGVGEGDEHWIAVGRAGERLDREAAGLEAPAPLLRLEHRVVRHVVHPPRERVQGGDRVPLRPRQEPDPPREVPRFPPRDAADLRVGVLDGHPHRRPRSSRTASRANVRRVGAGRPVKTSQPARSSASRAARPPRA